jgi:hypothetical protein
MAARFGLDLKIDKATLRRFSDRRLTDRPC